MTDALIRAAFGALDPLHAQFALDRDDYAARVAELQKAYRAHPAVKTLCSAVLEYTGIDPQQTGWDWLYLHVMPHGKCHSSRSTQKLGFHRDI